MFDEHQRNLLARVETLMADHEWRTPTEICDALGGTTSSITARLRDLRKPQFGANLVDRRLRAGHKNLYEYRVRANQSKVDEFDPLMLMMEPL